MGLFNKKQQPANPLAKGWSKALGATAELRRYEALYARIDRDAAKRKEKIAAKIAKLRMKMEQEGSEASSGN